VSSRRADIIEKIIARCVMVPNKALGTPCWVWQGPTSGSSYKGHEAPKKGRGHGYGRMALDGQTVAVHIVMWTCFNGYLPGKRQLDHLCDDRRCCNPSHLENVTHKQNQKRRAEKARRRHEDNLVPVPGRTDAWYDPSKMDQWTAEELARAGDVVVSR